MSGNNDFNVMMSDVIETHNDTLKQLSGVKHDQEKSDLTLLNRWALEDIARAFQFGADKYGRYNYRKGMQWTRIAGAALRHINAWVWGEDNDNESGLNHLAHAGACVFMLLDYVHNNLGEDNRDGSDG